MPIIKTEFGGECRLFEVDRPTYQFLADVVAERYNLIPHSFTFEFRDDEGDDCAITSDAELLEALRLNNHNNLTINVKGGKPAPIPEQPPAEVAVPKSPTSPVMVEKAAQPKAPFAVVRVAQPQQESPVSSIPFCSVDRAHGRFATGSRGGYTTVKLDDTPRRNSSAREQQEEARSCDDVPIKKSAAKPCEAKPREDSVPHEFVQELQNFLVEHAVRVSDAINAHTDVVFSGLALGQSARDIIEKLISCDEFLSQHRWVKSRFLPVLLPRMSRYFDNLIPMAKVMICSFIARIPAMLVLTPSILESVFKEEENQAVHHGFLCDGCGSDPIRGIRYRCTVRENYDLCEACEKRDTSGHPMTKIKVPVEAGIEQAGQVPEEEKKIAENVVPAPVENVVPEQHFVVVEPVVEPVEPIVLVAKPEPVVEPVVVPEPVVVQPEPVVQPVQPKMPVAQPVNKTRKFESQIQAIRDMGFPQDPDLLELLLQEHGGNVQQVMDVLLRG